MITLHGSLRRSEDLDQRGAGRRFAVPSPRSVRRRRSSACLAPDRHLPCADQHRHRRFGLDDKVAGPVGEALIMTAISVCSSPCLRCLRSLAAVAHSPHCRAARQLRDRHSRLHQLERRGEAGAVLGQPRPQAGQARHHHRRRCDGSQVLIRRFRRNSARPTACRLRRTAGRLPPRQADG